MPTAKLFSLSASSTLPSSHKGKVLVLEWAQDHRAELLEDWELCARKQSPKKIAPLP